MESQYQRRMSLLNSNGLLSRNRTSIAPYLNNQQLFNNNSTTKKYLSKSLQKNKRNQKKITFDVAQRKLSFGNCLKVPSSQNQSETYFRSPIKRNTSLKLKKPQVTAQQQQEQDRRRMSVYRSHLVSCNAGMSTEERELAQIKNRPTFKARPLNRNMLYGTLADRCKNMKINQNTCGHINIGDLQSIKKRKLSNPIRPNLSTQDRRKTIAPGDQLRRMPTQELQYQEHCVGSKFKARQLNKNIFKYPDFVPRKSQQGLTCPLSPQLETQRRNSMSRISKISESQYDSCYWEGTSSVRGRQMFKARPMPDFNRSPQFSLGRSSSSNVTLPQEFCLLTQHRGFLKQERFDFQQEQQQYESVKAREFKARPKPRKQRSPQIKPSCKPLTTPQNPALWTQKRALERKKHDIEAQMKKLDEQFQARERRRIQLIVKNHYSPINVISHDLHRLQSNKKLNSQASYKNHAFSTSKNNRNYACSTNRSQKTEVQSLSPIQNFKSPSSIIKGKSNTSTPMKRKMTVPVSPILRTEARAQKKKEFMNSQEKQPLSNSHHQHHHHQAVSSFPNKKLKQKKEVSHQIILCNQNEIVSFGENNGEGNKQQSGITHSSGRK